MHQYDIIRDVLGGWSKETKISVQSLVGRKTTQVIEIAEGGFIGNFEHNLPELSNLFSNMTILI